MKSITTSTSVRTAPDKPVEMIPAPLSPDQRRALEVKIGLISQKAADKFDQETNLPKLRLIIISNAKPIEYLGAGAFNQVYKVKVDGNQFLARKGLKAAMKNTYDDFKAGAVDLVHEAKLLNILSHPNILRLQGVSTDSWKDCYLNGESFFMYLDPLKGSISDKFTEWHDTKNHSCMNREMVKRLETIALPMAKAVAYLHERQIIFRDIKPSNMGFDANGVVQLYDFGLARELHPGKKLAGRTGTILYMAPEVALSQDYGLPADVYSFAMFLHECCSLTKPCVELIVNENAHFEQVVQGNYRPKLSEQLFSNQLQTLLTKAWAKDPAVRPTMGQVVTQLEECIDDLNASLKDNSWWSTHIMGSLAMSRSRSGEHKPYRLTRSRSSIEKAVRGKENKPVVTSPRSTVSNTWFYHSTDQSTINRVREKQEKPPRPIRRTISGTWFHH